MVRTIGNMYPLEPDVRYCVKMVTHASVTKIPDDDTMGATLVSEPESFLLQERHTSYEALQKETNELSLVK